MTPRLPRALAVPVLTLVLGVAAVGCGDGGAEGAAPERELAGYVRTPTPEVGDLSLPAVEADGSETDFSFRSAGDDQLLLVYFGYTSCPDVCPTTLSDVRLALEDLGGDAERVDLAMVTIDPEVDTPRILTDYVRSFVPGATVLRSLDDPELRTAAEGFGADYGIEEVDGERQVSHTGSLYVVDQAGQLLLTWPFGTPSSDLTADLDQLLDGVA